LIRFFPLGEDVKKALVLTTFCFRFGYQVLNFEALLSQRLYFLVIAF
jgi:hypothetical protein